MANLSTYETTVFLTDLSPQAIEDVFDQTPAVDAVRWDDTRFIITLTATDDLVEAYWTPDGFFLYTDGELTLDEELFVKLLD